MAKNRKQNLIQVNDEAILIEDSGHSIERFNDYHWRIDGEIDVWPSSKKFWIKEKGKPKVFDKLKDIFN